MNIILAEERADGVQTAEKSFNQGVILVGRDASECDIAFDNALFPMVSRKHAELRWQDGQWIVIDLNSTYGVFLNGQKLTSPQQAAVGSAIRFGTGGPVLRVVWFEVPYDSAAGHFPVPKLSTFNLPTAPPTLAQDKHSEPQSFPVTAQQAIPKIAESAKLEFTGTESRPPFAITKPSIWLGREPGCSIVFESDAVMVSRRHAEIRTDGDGLVLEDNNSFNGTLVNEQRISMVTQLYHNDEIRLGVGGPILRLNSPQRVAPLGASRAGQVVDPSRIANPPEASEKPDQKTVVLKLNKAEKFLPSREAAQPQLLMSIAFGEKKELKIGREKSNDISLDGLQISKSHARLMRSGPDILIEDLNSTNGVYINGKPVFKETIRQDDAVQIGSFLLRADHAGNISVFDTRSKTRIDAVNITKEVDNRSAGGKIKLLDSISFSIRPNEFVGFLGPSGAGKSTLMEAMNGMRPADSGNVLVNNLDLYRHLDSLKQSIGFVPQENVIHRELTVYRTLYYVAKLRLSRDVSPAEIRQIVDEVLDVTGLAERRNVTLSQLSGGQQKRVSIAVELITKPSVIFLDEPTSGLDPASEDKIMKLFRQIADSGRTVILTTHAMENVRMFDKIAVLMAGKLVFFGLPEDALKHLGASSFKELYERLEQPIEDGIRLHGEASRAKITEQTAEEWKQKYLAAPLYRENIQEPLKDIGTPEPTGVRKKHRLGVFGALSQWSTLSRRYMEVLLNDKVTLFILLAQAPVIALLTYFVMEANQPRDFVYFVLSLVAVWFGTSVSAREIVRERPVYKRERMVNLGLLPYLASKLFVLGVIVCMQCILLFLPLKIFDLLGLMPMPGELAGIPQLWAMLLTAGVGIAIGLLISALVRTSEMATSLVPLILIPQILFSGLVGVPSGISKIAALAMPAAWSFDTMKRFSTLDTLEEEGANPSGKTKGLGLFKFIDSENEKTVERAKEDFEEYKRVVSGQSQDDAAAGGTAAETSGASTIKKIPEDLSGYVTFLNPWMNEVLNQFVLVLMFGILVIATLTALRLKDN